MTTVFLNRLMVLAAASGVLAVEDLPPSYRVYEPRRDLPREATLTHPALGTVAVHVAARDLRNEGRPAPDGPSAEPHVHVAPSGMPLGTQYTTILGYRYIDIKLRRAHYTIHKMTGEVTTESSQALERFARRAIAYHEAAGLLSTPKVDGLRSWKSEGGSSYVRLADWAQEKGVNLEHTEGVIRFTVHGKKVVVPLASYSIQVDGKWIELSDLVLSSRSDERCLIPVDALAKIGG